MVRPISHCLEYIALFFKQLYYDVGFIDFTPREAERRVCKAVCNLSAPHCTRQYNVAKMIVTQR